jgi:succinyl-CoA synthetase alpha subunit
VQISLENKTEKPVVAFIAGHTAPPGGRMGHADTDPLTSGGDRRGEQHFVRGLQCKTVPQAISIWVSQATGEVTFTRT